MPRPKKKPVTLTPDPTPAAPELAPLDVAQERLALDNIFTRSRRVLENTLTAVEKGEMPVTASLIESVLKGIKLSANLLNEFEAQAKQREKQEKLAEVAKNLELPFTGKAPVLPPEEGGPDLDFLTLSAPESSRCSLPFPLKTKKKAD